MALRGLIGQERMIKRLEETLLSEELSHAYLIEGETGTGKRTLAKQLAEGILCLDKGDKPCHQCQSCSKVAHGNHPDLQWIEEEGPVKIEAIRGLQKEMQLKPYEGKYKVFVICHSETMTAQAQNALLKTLEEPPGYGILILLASNGNALLPTVLSRCQRIKLRPPGEPRVMDFLIQERGLSQEEAKTVAAFSKGILGRALSFLEDEAFKTRRETVINLAMAIGQMKPAAIFEQVQYLVNEKEHIEESLDILTSWFRDLLIFRETQGFQFLINYDKMKEIEVQAGRFDLKQLREIILIIDKAKGNLKSNVNYQLNLEVMLLNIQEVLSW